MRKYRFALLLLALALIPGQGLAAFTAMDGAGEAIEPGDYIAPGSEIALTCELPGDLGTAPTLRLRLSGMALEELTWEPGRSAGETPEIIYGSDGCILLFSEGAEGGAILTFRATAQAEPGEARASLLLEGEILMEIAHPVGIPPTPSPNPVPVLAPAEPESPSASWIPVAAILSLGALGAAGYWLIWPRVREKLKMKKEE